MPVLDDKEYPDLSHLNLILASNYKRYRRSEDHLLSAFWTKLFIGFCLTVNTVTLLEVAIVGFELFRFKQFLLSGLTYLFIIFGFWIGFIYLLHRLTLPNEVLKVIILYPEEYEQGQKLTLFYASFSGLIIILLLLLTKSEGFN